MNDPMSLLPRAWLRPSRHLAVAKMNSKDENDEHDAMAGVAFDCLWLGWRLVWIIVSVCGTLGMTLSQTLLVLDGLKRKKQILSGDETSQILCVLFDLCQTTKNGICLNVCTDSEIMSELGQIAGHRIDSTAAIALKNITL